jgi:hypothetical protein
MLLDRGADPNVLQQRNIIPCPRALTPRTAAMFQHNYGPTEVLDLLLKYGADIYGKEQLDQPISQASHIPLFAAAEAMATAGTIRMQWCLKHGANLNPAVSFT